MKSKLKVDEVLEAYLKDRLDKSGEYKQVISHFDCQDTEWDNNIECYFYIPVKYKDNLGAWNTFICELLGLDYHKPDIEDENDPGHPGEIRLEYIVTLGKFTQYC